MNCVSLGKRDLDFEELNRVKTKERKIAEYSKLHKSSRNEKKIINTWKKKKQITNRYIYKKHSSPTPKRKMNIAFRQLSLITKCLLKYIETHTRKDGRISATAILFSIGAWEY